MKRKPYYIILFILLSVGCASSRITNFWKKENANNERFKKIMVVGLIRDADRTLRQEMEDHMVQELEKIGYSAVSSLRELGPKALDQLDEQAAIRKLQGEEIDGIITIVLLNRHKERHFVPQRPHHPAIYGGFWDYRRGISRIYEDGYFVVSTRYFWESNLYKLTGRQLLFSVQTESFNPSSSQALAHEYAGIIIAKMVEERVLQNETSTGN